MSHVLTFTAGLTNAVGLMLLTGVFAHYTKKTKVRKIDCQHNLAFLCLFPQISDFL